MTTLTHSLRERLLEALEPFKRADTAIGSEPGPFRFETGSGHRLVERGDFRRLASLYDELKSLESEGGGKDAPIAASGSGETADPPPVRSVAPSVPEPAPASDGGQNASATSENPKFQPLHSAGVAGAKIVGREQLTRVTTKGGDALAKDGRSVTGVHATQPPSASEPAGADVRAAVEALAHCKINISLADWCRHSATLLAGADALDRLTAELAEARRVIEKIACFDDEAANMRLGSTGSYGSFDEPGSVEAARAFLSSHPEKETK